jgi:hypothetical protein
MTERSYAIRRKTASVITLVLTAATGAGAVAWAATTAPTTSAPTTQTAAVAPAGTTDLQRLRDLRHRLAAVQRDLPQLLRGINSLPRGDDGGYRIPTVTTHIPYVPPVSSGTTAVVAPPVAAPPASHTTTGASGVAH